MAKKQSTDDNPSVPANLTGQVLGRKGLQTRNRIVEAARSLLSERPLRDVNSADVARRAKTSAPTLYLYFESVEEVFLEALEITVPAHGDIVAWLESEWTADNAHREARKFIAAYQKHWRAYFPLMRVRNVLADEGDERFIELRWRSVKPIIDALTLKIIARQESGHIDPTLHPVSTAIALLASIERLAATAQLPRARGAGITPKRLSEALAAIVISTLGFS